MKHIRIEAPKPEAGKLAISQGTRFFCGDTEIQGVYEASVHFRIDEPVRAELNIYLDDISEVDALAVFKALDPITNKYRIVKRIEWEDGDVFEC